MTENQGRLRTLLDDTLTEEPPLVDLVHGAVAGFEQRRTRRRMAGAMATTAVLAVGVGAYSLTPAGSAKGGPTAPGGGSTTAAPVVRVAGDFGIPGLFDHPGTVQEQCSKMRGTPYAVRNPQVGVQAEAYCVRVLTQVRALFPDDVVVLNPIVDVGAMEWTAKVVTTPDGGVVPGFTDAYRKAAEDPAKVDYDPARFAYDGPHGAGTMYYAATAPGWKSKAQPGGVLPLGDGTSAHLQTQPNGTVVLSGVDSAGSWYELEVTGVTSLFGGVGSSMHPDLAVDGKDHEIFPDGHVATATVTKPDGHGGSTGKPGTITVPNPYSADQLVALLKGKGLGAAVRAMGPDPFVEFAPKVP